MAKRKNEAVHTIQKAKALKSRKEDDAPSSPKPPTPTAVPTKQLQNINISNPPAVAASSPPADSITFQIITGSYERVLHGFTATIPSTLVTGHDHTSLSISDLKDQPKVDFTDTFLFNAHASAIRCLALSPPSTEASKVLLATGSTDERINIYSLSKTPPSKRSRSQPKLPSLHGTSISENAKNKEMGSLLHHSSTVTSLYFPTRSKLLSASEDSTIAITRTRDWEPLSTIKAPIPKAQGRPSGDTAPPGEVPAGINAFAVHPSMKLMLSVSRGEKCMRLWNLVTGKKAGVLTFSKDLLIAVGETRFSSGEAKSVVWDPAGEEFAVAFDRGVVVFGIDCVPKCRILPEPRTKVHKLQYLPLPTASPSSTDDEPATTTPPLLISTEDGRILIYNTTPSSSEQPSEPTKPQKDNAPPPPAPLLAHLGGPAAGIKSRVKDFDILPLPHSSSFLIITGSSDGAVRLWTLDPGDITRSARDEGTNASSAGKGASSTKVAKANTKEKETDEQEQQQEQEEENASTNFTTSHQTGRLIGVYATDTRITCLKSFEMTGVDFDDDDDDDEGLDTRDHRDNNASGTDSDSSSASDAE
ncbi:unnamed protein product [Periconia digitata]|uniref:WD40 repeat-like protein n=1 Tax=Periconia digitata TaxID=1303443 RepID=A0A9W4UWG9_9PLEO|nr:unnamed protein product [Periconia digitata]